MEAFLKQGLLVLAALVAVGAAFESVSGTQGVGLALWIAAALMLCASVIARSARLGSLLTAVVAFSANSYLFSRKYDAAKATEAICNINAYFNCDKVNQSPWSEAFGVPITLLGMGFYAGVAFAAMVKDEEARRFHQLNLAFAVVNLVYSAFLGYQAYSIGVACILCIGIYGCNALLLWAGAKGVKQMPGAWDPMELGTSRDFVSIASVFLVVVAIGGWSYKAQKATNPIAMAAAGTLDDAALAGLYTEPCGIVDLDGTEPTWGPPTAPYQVVEWADYGCPHCAEASKKFKDFLAENKDVKLTFKVYPLTGECNPRLQPRDPSRCLAAYAAECARPQGKYFEMSHMLFENQGYFQDTDLEFMAKQVGLDVESWKACLQDPATQASVLNDAAAGEKAGVRGTPTIYLKGVDGDNWVEITTGADGVAAVIGAHRSGRPLPPAPPCPPAEER